MINVPAPPPVPRTSILLWRNGAVTLVDGVTDGSCTVQLPIDARGSTRLFRYVPTVVRVDTPAPRIFQEVA